MLIEVALTLPLVVYLIFFALELIKINLTQIAVDKIAQECTFSLINEKNVKEFDKIFEKYKPSFIPIERCRFYCRLYTSLDTMMSESPYGGEKIAYPDDAETTGQKPVAAATGHCFGLGGGTIYMAKYGNYGTGKDVGHPDSENYLASTVPSGYAFVLTVVVHYPFSSPLVEKLFGGGSNTTKAGYYILWARGSGIVN